MSGWPTGANWIRVAKRRIRHDPRHWIASRSPTGRSLVASWDELAPRRSRIGRARLPRAESRGDPDLPADQRPRGTIEGLCLISGSRGAHAASSCVWPARPGRPPRGPGPRRMPSPPHPRSRPSPRHAAASPGCTTTRCRRAATCRRRPAVRAARSSTTTTTGGWTSTSSTAARATSTRPTRPLAERALSQQSRRHVHRRHRQGRRRRRHVRHGRGRRRLRQRRLPGPLRHGVRPSCTLYHNNGNGTFTDVTEQGRACASPGWTTQRRLVRLRQRRPARPVRLQLRRLLAREQRSAAATTSWAATVLLHSAQSSSRRPVCLFHNNGDGTFTDVSEGTGIAARPRQGARRRGHRRQQRRPDGPVRRQRHGAEFPVREPGQRQVGGDRAVGRGRLPRQRPGRAPAWASTPPTVDGDGWQDLFVANVDQEMFSLYREHAATSRSPTWPTRNGSRRPRGC